MKYIICRKEAKLFLRMSGNIDWVKDKRYASRFKKEAEAERQLKIHASFYLDAVVLPATINDEVEEEESLLIDNNEVETKEVAMSSEEAHKRIDNIREGANLIARSTVNFMELLKFWHEEQKKCDQETQDILHKIELDEIPNPVDMWKLMKMLQDVRRRRREAKDNFTFLQTLEECGLSKMGQKVRACNYNLEHRSYQPRILTELFQDK